MKKQERNQKSKSTANSGFHHSHKPRFDSKPHHNSQSQNPNSILIFGKHPVFSALEKKRRRIFEILVTKNTQGEVEDFLRKKNLSSLLSLVAVTDNHRIENLIGKEQTHQGFVLRASRLAVKNQNDLLEELYAVEEGAKLPTLVMLDQISDPHNIGAIIRSAISFGAKKILFCEHNAPRENATIIKSSAGTIENAELFTVTNFSNLMEKLKKIGYWCIGLDGTAKAGIAALREYKNIALIIGSEGNGIRDLVKKNCDLLTKIEIAAEVESLNASVAASIALYEISQAKHV